MASFRRFLVSGLLAVAALSARDGLADARRAQQRLGPEVWSQVIRVENTAPRSRYPTVVDALVFEVAGLLWFYCDVDGTQSFSLHRGRLAEEKADFGPLLRDIEPGFGRWQVEPPAIQPVAAHGPLPNGCFIASLVAWREQAARGRRLMRPELLSYYIPGPDGLGGHTVLTFESERGLEVLDPTVPAAAHVFNRGLRDDPLALARAFDGPDVSVARAIPLDQAPAGPTAPAFATDRTAAVIHRS